MNPVILSYAERFLLNSDIEYMTILYDVYELGQNTRQQDFFTRMDHVDIYQQLLSTILAEYDGLDEAAMISNFQTEAEIQHDPNLVEYAVIVQGLLVRMCINLDFTDDLYAEIHKRVMFNAAFFAGLGEFDEYHEFELYALCNADYIELMENSYHN